MNTKKCLYCQICVHSVQNYDNISVLVWVKVVDFSPVLHHLLVVDAEHGVSDAWHVIELLDDRVHIARGTPVLQPDKPRHRSTVHWWHELQGNT